MPRQPHRDEDEHVVGDLGGSGRGATIAIAAFFLPPPRYDGLRPSHASTKAGPRPRAAAAPPQALRASPSATNAAAACGRGE